MKATGTEEVLSYIEGNQERYVGFAKEIVSQPSVSTQNLGTKECAEKVRQLMERVGLKVTLFPTRGNPVVFGEYRSPRAKRTILFYNHYDVQPAEPLEAWVSAPFKPEVREGKLYGRGSSDNKGTLTSRISALDAIIRTMGECPVNVKFMVEGDEEVGSPNLASFAESHKDVLAADAIIWGGSDRHPSERPTVNLGNKGLLYIEFRAMGPATDQHSSLAPMIPNPAWRLVLALATMKAPDGRVTVDGFYDDVKAPSRQSEELLDKVPVELEKEKQLAGLTHILGEEDLSKLKRNLFFQPVATINGLAAGYSGMGSKTIVPAEASAKMDIRLVPDQNPDEIHQKIRQHLDKRGFVDVVMDVVARMYPCRTDPESPIVKVTVDAARRVYQREPIVYPNHLGSGPMYVAVQILQRPVVAVGAAYYGSGMHSPNEHIRLDDYALATKLIASVLLEFPRAAG